MKGPALWEICVRLAVAAVLGAAIGAERESGGQDAGLRTHLMLSLVGLRPVRNAVRRASRGHENEITVVLRSGASPATVLRALGTAAITPTELHVGPRDSGSVEVVVRCDATERQALADLASKLSSLDDVVEVHVGRE